MQRCSFFFAGIDIGSTTTKAVVINENKQLLGSSIKPSGTNFSTVAETVFEEALSTANIVRESVQRVVATGFGRECVKFADETRTEIVAHARGCHFYYPEKITVVDIGGRDSKVINLDATGKILNFKMNRSCAAGTGMFLEVMAKRLEVELGEMDKLARRATKPVSIGSYCTVFASIEILDKLRAGEQKEDIVRGIFESIVRRAIELSPLESEKIILTGGVIAHNLIVPEIFRTNLNRTVNVPPYPQLTGAFGAALFASSEMR